MSIYRDGSKRTQPLNTSKDKAQARWRRWSRAWRSPCAAGCRTSGIRLRTSSTSRATRATSPSACSKTGQPGELFIVMAKEGRRSRASRMLLRRPSPRAAVRRAAAGAGGQVQPRALRAVGHDANPDIRFAKSIVDYIFRWLATKFLSNEAQYHAGVNSRDERRDETSVRCAKAAPNSGAAFREVYWRRRNRPQRDRYAAAAIRTRKTRRHAARAGQSW